MEKYYDLRKKLFDPLAWTLSKRELHDVMSKSSSNVNEILEHAEKYVGRGYYASIRSVQIRDEVQKLGKIVQQIKPETIVEIGTYKGGTLFLWCRANPQADTFISIDLPNGQYGGGYEIARKRIYREFIYDYPRAKMELIQADSHQQSTLEHLHSVINKKSVDFLYIDGDHTYDGAKQDFEMYAPLVKNGLIAFHDIATYSHGCGVYKLWEELKQDHLTQEIIQQGSNKGIGIVFVGEAEKMMSSVKNL